MQHLTYLSHHHHWQAVLQLAQHSVQLCLQKQAGLASSLRLQQCRLMYLKRVAASWEGPCADVDTWLTLPLPAAIPWPVGLHKQDCQCLLTFDDKHLRMLRTMLFEGVACVRLKAAKSRLSCLACNGGSADGMPLQGRDKRTTPRSACFQGPRVVLKGLDSCYTHLGQAKRYQTAGMADSVCVVPQCQTQPISLDSP